MGFPDRRNGRGCRGSNGPSLDRYLGTDPRNQSEARRNPRLWPMWQEEGKIELDGLMKWGCLKKVSRSSLPGSTRIIGSRFHYKIKRHLAGSNKLKVNDPSLLLPCAVWVVFLPLPPLDVIGPL